MKTNLQLLKLVEKEVSKEKDSDYCSCLCLQIENLYGERTISKEEKSKFLNYLDRNKPIGAVVGDYYFPAGEKIPRLKWLNKHIKKLSKK